MDYFLQKLCHILAKITEIVNKKIVAFHKTLSFDNSVKNENKKNLFPFSSMYVLFNDTTHNDEYIDRLKLSEQKNPFEYTVPPSPLKGGSEQKYNSKSSILYLLPTNFLKY